jgi:hypothetical protein
MFSSAQSAKSQLISAPFQKRYAVAVITGIADAGKDQGLTAIIHSPKVCFLLLISIVLQMKIVCISN